MFFKAFVFLIFLVFSAGCGSLQTKKPVVSHSGPEGKSIVIENYDGYAGQGRPVVQTFTSVPKRVLAVSGSTVDNLIFLGLEKHIAAVSACTTNPDYPEAQDYKQFKKLSEGYPSKEAVLGLKPDLIVSWGSLFGDEALGSVKYWNSKGIHTYVLSNTVPAKESGPRTLRKIITDLHNLEKIFQSNQSYEKISELEKRLAKLEEKKYLKNNRNGPGIVTVQYVYGNEYMGRWKTDLTTDIIEQAGGKSLDDEEGGKKSIEYLLKKNPDIIMIVDMPSRPGKEKIEALKKNPMLKNVSAIKNDNFFLIPYRAFYGGSVHTIKAAEELNAFIDQRF